jgi:primosomal protein N'
LLIQTTMPDHEVVRSVVAGDPSILIEAESDRRRTLSLPPHGALAIVEGSAEFAAALALKADLVVVPQRERWLVRAATSTILADALEVTERPANTKLRIEVDPARI